MKDDAVIKDNEAVYLLNEQTYLHLRENLQGVGYEVFDRNSPLPVEEGQIPREALGNTQRRIETARAYYLAEHQDEPVGRIQNVAVTTLEKFRSGVRRRRNLAPRSLPDNDVRFIDPMYNELFRIPDGGVVQITSIKPIPVCRPKTEYTSLHSSHALRCLAANFLRKEQYRMKLVLAEKPSVAMSLSKVIGANQRGDGYMEGNGYIVSWCVGHLVELSQPEAYDEKYAKWRYDDLPILPEHWQYQVSTSTKKQFGILKKLMLRKDDSDEDEEVDVNEDYEAESDDEPV